MNHRDSSQCYKPGYSSELMRALGLLTPTLLALGNHGFHWFLFYLLSYCPFLLLFFLCFINCSPVLPRFFCIELVRSDDCLLRQYLNYDLIDTG